MVVVKIKSIDFVGFILIRFLRMTLPALDSVPLTLYNRGVNPIKPIDFVNFIVRRVGKGPALTR